MITQTFTTLSRVMGTLEKVKFTRLAYISLESHFQLFQESDQRVVAELFYGVLRGSRYWTFSSVQSMWSEMSVLFRSILSNITDETIADWETCLSGASNKADPNRCVYIFEMDKFSEVYHWIKDSEF